MQSSPVSPHSTLPPHSAQRASTFWLLIPLWFQLSQPIPLQDKDSFGLHGSQLGQRISAPPTPRPPFLGADSINSPGGQTLLGQKQMIPGRQRSTGLNRLRAEEAGQFQWEHCHKACRSWLSQTAAPLAQRRPGSHLCAMPRWPLLLPGACAEWSF